MHKKIVPKTKKTVQIRSHAAVQTIIESADSVFNENNPLSLNARRLSAKSGYSIGTLYYYLNKAEDAFILMIIRRREQHFNKLIATINCFPEDGDFYDLAGAIIDSSFTEYKKMNKKSFFLVFRMILKFSKNPLAFDDALLSLVEPLIEAQKRNLTGTFRILEANELLLLLKTCFAIIRRPYLEQNSIAGTPRHRELAVDTMVRLLGD